MNITIKDIEDFPSKQAEEIQNKLKDIDEQGKLLKYFKEQYRDNLGAENSLAKLFNCVVYKAIRTNGVGKENERRKQANALP